MKSKKWSAKEKLRAVGETLSANENELGTFLRKEGLHSQQLQEWQDQGLSSLKSFEALVQQNKQLEREILRKDKALAEASAPLILQKKSQPDLGRAFLGNLPSLPYTVRQLTRWIRAESRKTGWASVMNYAGIFLSNTA